MKPVFVIVASLLLCLCCEVRAQDAAPTASQPNEQNADGGGISPFAVGCIIAGLLGAGGGGVALGRKSAVHIEPSPLSVDITQQMLPREDFEKYRAEQAKEMSNVHARIDRLAPSVAEIKGRLDHISTTQTTILQLLLKGKQ